jgi:hypothetical protein
MFAVYDNTVLTDSFKANNFTFTGITSI